MFHQFLLEQRAAARRAEGDQAQALQFEANAWEVERQVAVLRRMVEKVPGPIAA